MANHNSRRYIASIRKKRNNPALFFENYSGSCMSITPHSTHYEWNVAHVYCNEEEIYVGWQGLQCFTYCQIKTVTYHPTLQILSNRARSLSILTGTLIAGQCPFIKRACNTDFKVEQLNKRVLIKPIWCYISRYISYYIHTIINYKNKIIFLIWRTPVY